MIKAAALYCPQMVHYWKKLGMLQAMEQRLYSTLCFMLCMMAHAYYPNTWKLRVGGLSSGSGKRVLQNEMQENPGQSNTLTQNQTGVRGDLRSLHGDSC